MLNATQWVVARGGVGGEVGGPVGGRHHHKSLGWDPGPMYPLFVMLVKHFARDRLTIFRF